jgi:hypothetical protein
MFLWYQEAAVCYAYLFGLKADVVDPNAWITGCRWFGRGWTLQELIAPQKLLFYDANWVCRGDKLKHCLALFKHTGIDPDVLMGRLELDRIPIGRRMSWAVARTTTRVEDMAYSLLGIFNVKMPLIYGERQNAFARLQEEIVKSTNDVSIFAWQWKRYA